VKFEFSSNAPRSSKEALEKLLFLNPHQHLVRDGILNSLAKFGHPQLVETEHGWSVSVGTEEAQTLFAFDRARLVQDPVGVVVFLRTPPSDIVIAHVAVHPDYALQAGNVGAGLGVTLIEKVMEIATRIVGVKRIVFFYRQQVVIQLTLRTATSQ
jgi:ribosomal protein S18 acetylase RimI-like enzyme